MSEVGDIVESAISALSPEQQSDWREIQKTRFEALSDMSSWTHEHRRAVRCGLAAWAMQKQDAGAVLGSISRWSRRLGVAVGCTLVRPVLPSVEPKWQRWAATLDTAFAWAMDSKSKTEVLDSVYKHTSIEDMCQIRDLTWTEDTAKRSASIAAQRARNAAYKTVHIAMCNSIVLNGVGADVARALADAVAWRDSSQSAQSWNAAVRSEGIRLSRAVGEDLLCGPIAEWIG